MVRNHSSLLKRNKRAFSDFLELLTAYFLLFLSAFLGILHKKQVQKRGVYFTHGKWKTLQENPIAYSGIEKQKRKVIEEHAEI